MNSRRSLTNVQRGLSRGERDGVFRSDKRLLDGWLGLHPVGVKSVDLLHNARGCLPPHIAGMSVLAEASVDCVSHVQGPIFASRSAVMNLVGLSDLGQRADQQLELAQVCFIQLLLSVCDLSFVGTVPQGVIL